MRIGRTLSLVAIVVVAVAVVGGCQNYNFNPVGSCVIQPGATELKLADVTTADMLFVVDDSGSMTSKQVALANNFNTFISSLNATNEQRVSQGLQPFDFHIAVTTSSIFEADPNPNGSMCLVNSSTQKTQCCAVGSCSAISSCTPGEACGSGGKCVFALASNPATNPSSFAFQCCTTSGNCSDASCFPGDACPLYTTQYPSSMPVGGSCDQGVAVPSGNYPDGSFVSASGNPKVLHFTKELYTSPDPTTGKPPNTTAINALSQQFQQNIQVGSCGSGEEQHLQAGRLSLQKVLAGTYGSDFPHPGAKLIVLWIGDEDDCSSPQDPSQSVVLSHGYLTGADECVADKNLPAGSPIPHRAYAVSDFYSFFTGLLPAPGASTDAQHPWSSLGAAFVVSSNKCTQAGSPTPYAPADSSYLQSPAVCTGTPQYACSVAFAGGVRFLQLAESLRDNGYGIVEGSVCEDFGPILGELADLVKAPSALRLPSVPAANEIALMRILDSSGRQRKLCTQAPPCLQCGSACVNTLTDPTNCGACGKVCGGSTPVCDGGTCAAACKSTCVAGSSSYCCEAPGWWFVNCQDTTSPPAVAPAPTSCVYINHQSSTQDCEANPGETYSAEYLGQVPPGGCANPTATPHPSQACATALGGSGSNQLASDWWCYGTGTVGTCVCSAQQ
ncbi:MAG TPA: hypothetical protein VMK42_04120 [Anaeromyxobacteraceae bacterium]|nr:hypothetical protein [Anaeromyxobacteraceae bacterium]